MQSLKAALELLLSTQKEYKRVEKIALPACLNRVLAADVYATSPNPAKATAAMDGYAFAHGVDKLKLVGVLPAGKAPSLYIKPKECIKTFTGSLMSEGCDTLVPVENVELLGDEVLIKTPVAKGFAVRGVGESYHEGELLLKAGLKLGYSELALLAELGLFHISVFIRPIVGVLSSGSELLDLGESSSNPASLRSSNHIALASMARQIGCEARIFPILKDDKASVKAGIDAALQSCDILVSTGGVSMGDYDFLKEAVKDFDVLVDKVAIKPGRHIKIAKTGDKYFFALPGFPVAAMVCFTLFVRELVFSMLKLEKDYKIQAILEHDYQKRSDLLEFVACNLDFKEGFIGVNTKGKKMGSSAILNNLNKKAALMIAKNDLKAKSLVDILMMV